LINMFEDIEKKFLKRIKRVEGWGLLYEGPVRRFLRYMLGRALGVPGSPRPLRDWFKYKFLATSNNTYSQVGEQQSQQGQEGQGQ